MNHRDKLIGGLNLRDSIGAEIGPLCRPVVSRGEGKIFYVDHADTDTLRKKYAIDPAIDVSTIVDIDAVWGLNTLYEAMGGQTVDYIVASHVIEHVPDLITWIAELRSVLRENGHVRLAVPDKRFTFDHLRRETSLADVLAAYIAVARRPQLQQIIEYRLNSAPLDCAYAWATPIGDRVVNKEHTFDEAMQIARYFAGNSEYHDVHCWVFTPRSFANLFASLAEVGLIDFECERFYDTAQRELEFFVWLRPSSDRIHIAQSWKAMANAAQDFIAEGQPRVDYTKGNQFLLERLHEMEELCSSVQDQLSRAKLDLLIALNDAEAKKSQIELMEKSRSWKVTKPLRLARSIGSRKIALPRRK